MKSDLCRGCAMAEYCYIEPTIKNKKGVLKYQCPCSICLVKTICEESCQDFNLHILLTYNNEDS